jgi:hypothetical protein
MGWVEMSERELRRAEVLASSGTPWLFRLLPRCCGRVKWIVLFMSEG